MVLAIPQFNPDLWGLIRRMDGANRRRLLCAAFASAAASVEKSEIVTSFVAAFCSERPIPNPLRKSLELRAEEMESRSRRRYLGAPESEWLEPFREARFANAALAVLDDPTSAGQIDSALYELAYAHWPAMDTWLEEVAMQRARILAGPTGGNS